MARIYLASSWRNKQHPTTLNLLRNRGHQVYDFTSKEEMPGGGPTATSFKWTEMSKEWESWSPTTYRRAILTSPRAASGYLGDQRGMEWADTCVMLLPCGRSAHLEAGYMKGRGKHLVIAYPDDSREGFEPDLMYLLADNITVGFEELLEVLKQ